MAGISTIREQKKIIGIALIIIGSTLFSISYNQGLIGQKIIASWAAPSLNSMSLYTTIIGSSLMRTTTILVTVAIVAALCEVTSILPIHQASAAPGLPQYANGQGSLHSNDNAMNQGTFNAFLHTPHNQPCSIGNLCDR